MTMPIKRLRTLLAVSAVLNIFLLGAIGGGAYRWIEKQKADALAQQRGLRFAAAELPQARRDQLRDALRQTRRETLPLILSARSGRIDVVQALQSPQFDRAALDAALARTRDADMAVRARVEGTVADFAATLDAGERMKLVDALQRHGPLHVGPAPKK
ncbi:membrane protein [Caballeronia sordidicola]|uniref:Membrane protein n=1 Tax=Caballeronia sordidicola TaxID=196367 RepID=A0A158HC10_CABSO|nr:periplasmic heavy metal sensor [Caballeronia sordidicola]SAL41511.1 membrane protein [Caballeronia sordidicola]